MSLASHGLVDILSKSMDNLIIYLNIWRIYGSYMDMIDIDMVVPSGVIKHGMEIPCKNGGFWLGKSPRNGPFSIAMFDYQRVYQSPNGLLLGCEHNK